MDSPMEMPVDSPMTTELPPDSSWDHIDLGIFSPKSPLSPIPDTQKVYHSPERSEKRMKSPPPAPVKRRRSIEKEPTVSPKELFDNNLWNDLYSSDEDDSERCWLPSNNPTPENRSRKESSTDRDTLRTSVERKKNSTIDRKKDVERKKDSTIEKKKDAERIKDATVRQEASRNTSRTEPETFTRKNNYSYFRRPNMTWRRGDYRRPYRPRDHHRRQIFHHQHGMAVLAIHNGNYTISNGITSVSVDESNAWHNELASDVLAFNVKRLFVVDVATQDAWLELARTNPNLARIKYVLLHTDPAKLGNCVFCHTPCHRWKAIGGGIHKLYQFPVEEIRH